MLPEEVTDKTDEIIGCILVSLDYQEEESIYILEFLNPVKRRLFHMKIKAVGRHCDDFWLSYTIERAD